MLLNSCPLTNRDGLLENLLLPIVAYGGAAFIHQSIEAGGFLEHDLAEDVILPANHGLQPDHFQDRKERTDQSRTGAQVPQQLLQPYGAVLDHEATAH